MKMPYKVNRNRISKHSDNQKNQSDEDSENEDVENGEEEEDEEERIEDEEEQEEMEEGNEKEGIEEEVKEENWKAENVEMDNETEMADLSKLEKKRKSITDDVTNSAPQKKKKLDSSLYKPPTVEELNQLRETENLFHSNLFRLQIEEMLNEVRFKEKYKRLFNDWFGKFKKTIESIEETEEYKLADNNLEEQLNVHIPMPDVPKDTKYTFKFLKPSSINIVGSYAFDATVGPDITVDVMIEMPAKMFQKQDYQNYRYIKKRAMYLAYIASSIQGDISESKMYIGNNLRPALKVIPNGKLGSKVNVLVHVSAEESSFKLNRFLPEKNSIRPAWFHREKNENNDLPPTPHYNSIILHDLTMSRINSEVMKVIKEYPNLRDGIILLKIWLAQRELIKGFDAFNGYIITMFTLYLLSVKKLNTFMSSYQIVRNVWNNLVQVDWCKAGITMVQEEDYQKRVLDYQKYYDCVFLDNTGYHNIMAHVSKATFSWVQREAQICLKHLDSAQADSFQSLFMRKVPFYRSFDHLLCFKDAQVMKDVVTSKSTNNDKLDYGPNYRAQIIKIITDALRKGLSDRVRRICFLPEESVKWKCTEDNDDIIGNLFIGLELNPEFCYAVVDKGPEANLPEAIEFRKFWGKKSDLRRFQDGSIREAVVWSKGKTLSGKRLICKKIVNYLLTKKLGVLKNQYTYIGDEMEEVLKLHKIKLTHFAYGTGEEATLKVIQVFNALEKDLMSLTDIPLSIHGVQGSSPVFRYTDVFPPLATVYRPDKKFIKESKNCLVLSEQINVAPRYVHPLEVSLQLSTSGKWPDELEAIKKTKAAFHLEIAECLRKQYKLVTNANASHVDVLKDGFVFRLRVAHQKEIAFMKQQTTEDGVIRYRDTEESMELENRLFELPKLSSALHGLHVQQPSFGPTCCLTKRWLSAQMLDNSHIPDIVVELLVASMFLSPAPYTPPQMPQIAFLRLLEIFARGHWNTDPVIVNFNGEMSREEIVAVETIFGSTRSTLPPLFISTLYDQQKSLLTKKAPTVLILNRITALARQSLKLFEDELFTKTTIDLKPLFRPPLTEYDCLIQLKPCTIPRKLQAIDNDENERIIEWHPYKKHSSQKIPVVDFDPVQYFLKELRNGYGEFALFFYDTYGGTVIGVLLKPPALEPKDFKISGISCRKYDNGKLVLNVSAMIQDFYILGKGIVEAIDVRSKRFSLS